MTTKKQQKLFIAVGALVALTIGIHQSAWARGDGDGIGRRGFSGGVLQQLVFPCQATCHESARDCTEPLETEAVASVQSSCATQVSTAQTACAADRRATACRDALTALRACGESALTSLQTGIAACRDTQASCIDACETAQ